MIPKIIHYCWFSNDEKPRYIKRCINSWKKKMPEYKVICWDPNSFDFNSIPYTREAYRLKKWAFVADYIRFYALYKYGGIYLDSDIKVLKPLDSFLNADFFVGTEAFYDENQKLIGINPDAAQFGSCANNPILKECMEYYENNEFIIPAEGITNILTSPALLGKVLQKYGYIYKDEYQKLKNNTIIYPNNILSNIYSYNNLNIKPFTIHHLANSWMSDTKRGFIYRFCKNYNIMSIYHIIEQITRKINLHFNKQKN